MNEILEYLENDRKRIANDLHDFTLQNLTFLSHKIELASMMIDKDPIQAKLELAVLNKQLRSTINDIRDVVFGLHPLVIDDLGLKASFERLFSVINQDMKFQLDLEIEEVSCEKRFVLVSIFRIVQECVQNIVKHANADKIVFRCKVDKNKCNITIEDNGQGFDTAILDSTKGTHFGMSMIHERIVATKGEINIETKPGEGVKVFVSIPLN